jgi:hypothetical protein
MSATMTMRTFARLTIAATLLVALAHSPLTSTVEAVQQDGSPGSGSCSTLRPAATWVCVGDGWVPPDHPLAKPAPPPVLPWPSEPRQLPASCPGATPAAGWVCLDGGWLPPDHPLARPVLADGTYLSIVPLAVPYTRTPRRLASYERLVFRDREQWIAQRDGLLGGPPTYGGWPEVDFAHEMVIVASSGTQVYGTTITAVSAAMEASGPSVLITTRIPDASCGYGDHPSTPVEVVRVPRSDLPVSFKERVEPFSCTRRYDLTPAFECGTTRPAAGWSCGSDGNWVPPGFPAAGGEQLRPVTLLDAHLEGPPRRIVLRDRVMWKALWQEIYRETKALPEVDFTTEMLVVAAYGTTAMRRQVIVEAASLDATGLTIAIRTDRVFGSCFEMPSVAAPLRVVRLPRSDVPVVFLERHLLIDCRNWFY